MLRSTFSILTLLVSLISLGQPAPPKKEKEPVSFRPYEVKIGVNAIRSIRTFAGDDLTTHEFQTALAIHKYNVVVDFGVEEHKRGDSFAYENKGSYYRIGIDRNFTKDRASGNVLSLGLRYARAGFEDQLMFTTTDQGFGEQDILLENSSLSARWMEVTFNIRGRIVSNLYMGFTMRWQFLRKINGEGDLKTFDIPGFGKTRRQNSTAFDYYLMWRIPFKE